MSSKRIAVMQPYFLPYVGYFQLINSVDEFVFFDDVNFINRGWINRNNFMVDGKSKLCTVSLSNASQNKLINEIMINEDEKLIWKTIKTLESNYRKSKNFDLLFEEFKKMMLAYSNKTISEFNINFVKWVSEIIGINTHFLKSSDIKTEVGLKGQERIISICKHLNAGTYVNLPGGKDLYNPEVFRLHNVKLEFVEIKIKKYIQLNADFIGGLSIFDLLMNIELKDLKEFITV